LCSIVTQTVSYGIRELAAPGCGSFGTYGIEAREQAPWCISMNTTLSALIGDGRVMKKLYSVQYGDVEKSASSTAERDASGMKL
jgi:hypothetical protein